MKIKFTFPNEKFFSNFSCRQVKCNLDNCARKFLQSAEKIEPLVQ